MTVRSKLRANETCPIHRSKVCCGRAPKVRQVKVLKYRLMHDGTKLYPCGREVCPPSVLKRRKDRMLSDGVPCIACGEPLTDYEQVELGHRTSKGMNGGKRRDNFDNIGPQHKSSNRRMGSMNLSDYLSLCQREGIHPCQ